MAYIVYINLIHVRPSSIINYKAYSNIKTFLPLITTCLGSFGSLSLINPYITLSVINDLTGHNAQATIPANRTIFPLVELFRNSSININSYILATSAQLIQFARRVSCSLKRDNIEVSLNNRKTFTVLNAEDTTTAADVSYVTFQCHV